MTLYAYRNCGVAKYFFRKKTQCRAITPKTIQLIHYSDKHESLYTCLKMFLDSCFVSMWSTSFSVQVPAIVAHHSIAWLSLVTCFNLRNVWVKPFTVLIAYISQIVMKKVLSVNANGSSMTYDYQAYDMQSTCLAQHRHNSRFLCYLENCVSFA